MTVRKRQRRIERVSANIVAAQRSMRVRGLSDPNLPDSARSDNVMGVISPQLLGLPMSRSAAVIVAPIAVAAVAAAAAAIVAT
jgi:hypothetical protein